ncbi:MAG TPA: hypothetical protein VLS94_04665 [Fusibacter sp.]|nr:hypothetical protein [Fusibacter sp.]
MLLFVIAVTPYTTSICCRFWSLFRRQQHYRRRWHHAYAHHGGDALELAFVVVSGVYFGGYTVVGVVGIMFIACH